MLPNGKGSMVFPKLNLNCINAELEKNDFQSLWTDHRYAHEHLCSVNNLKNLDWDVIIVNEGK
uniref:Uncharacterized protein n=1 Tax=Romanomermis culicivorax TaxID=13658 RepID=A0A915JNL4_ROMCU